MGIICTIIYLDTFHQPIARPKDANKMFVEFIRSHASTLVFVYAFSWFFALGFTLYALIKRDELEASLKGWIYGLDRLTAPEHRRRESEENAIDRWNHVAWISGAYLAAPPIGLVVGGGIVSTVLNGQPLLLVSAIAGLSLWTGVALYRVWRFRGSSKSELVRVGQYSFLLVLVWLGCSLGLKPDHLPFGVFAGQIASYLLMGLVLSIAIWGTIRVLQVGLEMVVVWCGKIRDKCYGRPC